MHPETSAQLFQEFCAHIGDTPETNDYGVLRNNIWNQLPGFRRVLFEGHLGRIACQLLQTQEVLLFQDNVIFKPAGTTTSVRWHQDYSYWPLNQAHGITLWVALTPSTKDNGCLHFGPETHLFGERCPADFIADSGQPGRADLPPLDLALLKSIQPMPVKAGDIIAHHPFVWHMSPPNLSATPRCGWSLTFIHPQVRWDPGHAPHPFNIQLNPNEGDRVAGPLFPLFQVTLPPSEF